MRFQCFIRILKAETVTRDLSDGERDLLGRVAYAADIMEHEIIADHILLIAVIIYDATLIFVVITMPWFCRSFVAADRAMIRQGVGTYGKPQRSTVRKLLDIVPPRVRFHTDDQLAALHILVEAADNDIALRLISVATGAMLRIYAAFLVKGGMILFNTAIQHDRLSSTLFRIWKNHFIRMSVVKVSAAVRPVLLTGSYRYKMDISMTGLALECIIHVLEHRRFLVQRILVESLRKRRQQHRSRKGSRCVVS